MQTYFDSILILLKPTKYPDGVLNNIFQVLFEKKMKIFLLKEQAELCLNEISEKQAQSIIFIDNIQKAISETIVCLAIGGDGTMISAARNCTALSIPIIGVNLGTVGFLTDIPFKNFEEDITQMLSGQFQQQYRTLIEASIYRKNEEIFKTMAFNDVTFARAPNSALISYQLSIDEKEVAHTRADGIIVSTPSGSTAYALASGGPIIEPQTPAFLLVPICPQNLSNRPLVVPDTRVIKLKTSNNSAAIVHFDGHAHQELQSEDVLICRKAIKQAIILHPNYYDYYKTLRSKLHWNYNGS